MSIPSHLCSTSVVILLVVVLSYAEKCWEKLRHVKTCQDKFKTSQKQLSKECISLNLITISRPTYLGKWELLNRFMGINCPRSSRQACTIGEFKVCFHFIISKVIQTFGGEKELITVGIWGSKMAKKVFKGFGSIFHFYLIRGLQNYQRNLICTVAFWATT